MSVWNIRSNDIIPDATGKAQGRQTRRHFLSFSAPVVFLLAGALSACGKKGDLEAPPPAAEASGTSEGSTGSAEEGTE